MKYLKLFSEHQEYENIKSGITLPNVSRCNNEKHVHYNPREVIVSAIIRTSDFDKIVYGNGEGYVQYSSIESTHTFDDSPGCQYKTNLYYYKNFDLIQRENGVNVAEFSDYYLFVTYSQDEYENVKRTNNQETILLTQDGSLISRATYKKRNGLSETQGISYLDENGECITDENTGECMIYNGKYDVHVSYAVNLINPDVNAVLQRYTIFQDDGIVITSDFYKIYFNEQDFLNGSADYSLWLDMDGTVRGVKEDGEVIKDKEDNYITENVIPRFDENGKPRRDSQRNLIYYNNKYIVKTPVDDIPFSSIRIDGQRIDLNKLVLDDRGFYVLEEGEHLIEYALKNRREIPSYAFNSCVALEDVKIPKKVKKIDIDAFSNCPLLGTDENTIMRICSVDSEPIVVEAMFDFEENEEKILQAYASGIFNTPSSSDGGSGDVIKKVSETRETYNNDDTTASFGNYYVINNGIVADVDCVVKTYSTEK